MIEVFLLGNFQGATKCCPNLQKFELQEFELDRVYCICNYFYILLFAILSVLAEPPSTQKQANT